MTTKAELNEMTTQEKALHYRLYTYRREIKQAGGAAIMSKHYSEFWNVDELEQNFNVRNATFSYGIIMGIVRLDTGDTGSLAFGDVMDQRFYYAWRHEVAK